MLCWMSPQLAFTSLCIFPPVVGIGLYFGRQLKGQQKLVQAALAASSSVAGEVSRCTFERDKS
jgi:ABC-type bacteriocin/lantibiotic exporter with double-glycine peptidase domain